MKNSPMHFQELCKRWKANVFGPTSKVPIEHILFDSRQYFGQTSALFFALRGDVHEGHDFILELYQKGLRHFVVEEVPNLDLPDACFAQVKNSIDALQQLGGWQRKRMSYPVIGITGSNGKTCIKEWVFQLLHQDFSIVRSPKSYNSQIGVPISLFHMRHQHSLAIIEVGISRPGEMKKLERIVRPQIGIFANIGSAHQENFRDLIKKVKEKAALFSRCETVIYCADHKLIKQELEKKVECKHFRWSVLPGVDLHLKEIEKSRSSARLNVIYGENDFWIELPFSDKAAIENCMHCLCLMLLYNMDISIIQRRMSMLEAVDMRLELKGGIYDSLLINDSYNSDMESLRIALDFLNQQKKKRPQWVVLSDMEQTGLSESDWISTLKDILNEHEVEHFIGIGPILNRNRKAFQGNANFFLSTEAFIAKLPYFDLEKGIFLLKGARRFQFEKIQSILESQLHETVLEINLNALANNLNLVRAQLKEGVKLMAVVKAFGYGTGSGEIASVLQYQKVDYLAVAFTDEGIALRRTGIGLPIMVMNPEPQTMESMIDFNLEPEIYSFRILSQFLKALVKRNYSAQRYSIHLKLDSGMHRLGFEDADLDNLLGMLVKESQIYVATVFSHLAATDDPSFEKETRAQIDQFKKMGDRVERVLGYKPMRHILNSAGIRSYPNASLDMVRLGIGLYTSKGEKERTPVARLTTHISQIKWLRKGEKLGYSFSFEAPIDMKIATIAIGYADGFDRRLSNGIGSVAIGAKRAKVVGKICMDMCMVDVTHIDCQEGDEVEVFGKIIELIELADQLNTIPYEILTSISQRVKRIYIQR